MTTRVLVVDDSAVFRRAISAALAGLPGVEVAGTAANGKLALDRLRELRPDVMTLDLEMPEMNGIEVLRAMRASGIQSAAIMLSACTVRGGRMTIRALDAGAFDFVPKPDCGTPDENIEGLRDSLRPILETLARQREIRTILNSTAIDSRTKGEAGPIIRSGPFHPGVPVEPKRSGPPIVLIGVSTGGPAALAQLLPALPAKLAAPVLIVQHMPPHFTGALAERLESLGGIRVREARDGEPAKPGRAYLAPGGRHMKAIPGRRGEIVIRITDDPPENACRPSVDYLFRSVATHFPGRAIAAILTGMGNDGAEGVRVLKQGGSFNIAQDEASCVVFGMPREAIMSGAVDSVLPLGRISSVIQRLVAQAFPLIDEVRG